VVGGLEAETAQRRPRVARADAKFARHKRLAKETLRIDMYQVSSCLVCFKKRKSSWLLRHIPCVLPHRVGSVCNISVVNDEDSRSSLTNLQQHHR